MVTKYITEKKKKSLLRLPKELYRTIPKKKGKLVLKNGAKDINMLNSL